MGICCDKSYSGRTSCWESFYGEMLKGVADGGAAVVIFLGAFLRGEL